MSKKKKEKKTLEHAFSYHLNHYGSVAITMYYR